MASIDVSLPQWAVETLWQHVRHLALYGGRGAGKSRSVATALVLQAAEGKRRILCAREVQRSIKDSVKRLLDDEIDRLGLRHLFVSTETEIRGPKGSLFLFAGLRGNAASIKSIEGITDCWVEEAQTISQASIDTLMPTIRQPGSRLIWTWNPDLVTDPVDVLFNGPDGSPPDSLVRKVNYDENPWFPDVLRVEMEWDRARDVEKYRHVWEGAYRANTSALVFRNWRIEDFETPPDAIHRLGADFGFSIDPSVLVRCHLLGRTLYIDHEAYGVGVEIMDLPAMFMQVPDAEKWAITADTARPETISHLRRNGFPKIMSAVKGAKSLEDGVAWLQSMDIVVHPRCRHTIAELGSYSYKTDPLTGLVTPLLQDKDNHVIDALRYACEGARRAGSAKDIIVKPPPMANKWGALHNAR